LSAVACGRAGMCMAAGHCLDLSGVMQPLAEVLTGTSWAVEPTPGVAGGGALDGLSCTSANACTGVGEYTDTPGQLAALAEHWVGTAWSVQPTAPIVRATSAVVNDVSAGPPPAWPSGAA
jgi:hypothetical protein